MVLTSFRMVVWIILGAFLPLASATASSALTHSRSMTNSTDTKNSLKHKSIAFMYAAVLEPAIPDGEGSKILDPKKIRIINLGPIVNTEYLDYAPTISADGKTLYFVSNRSGSKLNSDGSPSHDFWAAKKNANLDTNFAKPFNIDTTTTYGEQGVNTTKNEGVASIAADRQTLVFTGCNRPDGYGGCDLYITDIEGDVWGRPRNLGAKVNSNYWDSQPSITSDKSRIYFSSVRPNPNGNSDGSGNRDIWYTDFDEETSTWKPAVNMTSINTDKEDEAPFIFPDNTTLFYSSNGTKPNIGKKDFYVVRKIGTTADGKDQWSKPDLLPEPINTKEDDFFISLPASGDVLYFSSRRTDLGSQGDLDNFMAFIPSFTKAIQVITSVVDECSGANIPAVVTIKNPITGRIVKDSVNTAKTSLLTIFGNNDYGNPKDSVTSISLEITANHPKYGEKKVVQVIKKPARTEDKKSAETPDIYEVKITLGQRPVLEAQVASSEYSKKYPNDPEIQNFRGLVMRQKATISLNPLLNYIFFDEGSSVIPSRYTAFKSTSETTNFTDERVPGDVLQKYYNVMNIIGYRLRKFPDAKVEIVGCNDGTTPSEKVAGLSKTRAQQVYDYLKNIWSISESRLKLTSRDLPERVSSLKDSVGAPEPKGIMENRRVEILCEDWNVMKPILDTDPKILPQPEDMTFVMKNGIDDAIVSKRRIMIARGDKPWKEITDIGVTNASYVWDWESNEGNLPDTNSKAGKGNALISYKAKLIVTSTTGAECESEPITIPILYKSTSGLAIGQNSEKTLEKYNLILFPFNSYDPGPRNERILNEYVYPRVFKSSEIEVEGHTDVVGKFNYNQTLSENRAKTVETGIKSKSKGAYGSLVSGGTGELKSLYSNDLPEGRFYNRTVQIVVQTPLDDAKLNEK